MYLLYNTRLYTNILSQDLMDSVDILKSIMDIESYGLFKYGPCYGLYVFTTCPSFIVFHGDTHMVYLEGKMK